MSFSKTSSVITSYYVIHQVNKNGGLDKVGCTSYIMSIHRSSASFSVASSWMYLLYYEDIHPKELMQIPLRRWMYLLYYEDIHLLAVYDSRRNCWMYLLYYEDIHLLLMLYFIFDVGCTSYIMRIYTTLRVNVYRSLF